MKIVDDECLACASFEKCGTHVMKGSIMCCSYRISNRQTKKEMHDALAESCRKESGRIDNGKL